MDPSFADALGPVQLIVDDALRQLLSGGSYFPPTFSTTTEPIGPLAIACLSGHHFEPPSLDSQRPVVCAPNGLWVDADILSVRRCVKDRLSCRFPLADLGGLYCEPRQTNHH